MTVIRVSITQGVTAGGGGAKGGGGGAELEATKGRRQRHMIVRLKKGMWWTVARRSRARALIKVIT
jgi:hypothetical protein